MREFMERAIELAKLGKGRVNPNPLVGAVVVKNGQIIGEGYHAEYGGHHAEVDALEDAGEDAKGSTLYVTLEPCSHYGKTPPCARLIVEKKIKRCVIGIKDPNPLVAGRGIAILKEAGIEVEVGLLEERVKKLNRVFLHYMKNREPYFYLKTAITLDGKIACSNGHSKWISNEKSRAYVQKLRNEFMGIMVGLNTIKKDNPNLTARVYQGVNPIRITIDPYLDIDLESNFVTLAKDDRKSLIVTSEQERQKAEKLREYGLDFIFLPTRTFPMRRIKKELYNKGIDSVLIEGGNNLISQLFQDELIDAGTIFVAPKISGDEGSISIVSGRSIESMEDAILLEDVEYEVFGDNIAMHFGGD